MKLIIGLGNPGVKYGMTRHNAGFHAIDHFARQLGLPWQGEEHHAIVAQGIVAGEKVLLAKPQTYMNESGRAVGALVRYYKIAVDNILILCDDLDLPVGRIRMREKGSAGGQHGIESIITHLGTQQIARLRIGIGRPARGKADVVSYVLSIPPLEERIDLSLAEEHAADAVMVWLRDGIAMAMNQFNADSGQSARGTT